MNHADGTQYPEQTGLEVYGIGGINVDVAVTWTGGRCSDLELHMVGDVTEEGESETCNIPADVTGVTARASIHACTEGPCTSTLPIEWPRASGVCYDLRGSAAGFSEEEDDQDLNPPGWHRNGPSC